MPQATPEPCAPYLETDGPVNKVEVQVVQLQVAECLLAGPFHQAFLVVCGPQLKPARQHMLPLPRRKLFSPLEARRPEARGLTFLSPPTHVTTMLDVVVKDMPPHNGGPNFPKEQEIIRSKIPLRRTKLKA